jgi:hypothetical protein
MSYRNLDKKIGQLESPTDPGQIAYAIQESIADKIVDIFNKHGKKAPDLIRGSEENIEYRQPFEYAKIGLKLPPIMGGEVYANINVERLVDDKNGNIQAYAILPGKDGENKMTIDQIADGIVDSYNLEVRRNLISL